MACVYIHLKKTNREIFYVGIGTLKRAFSTYGRNKYWDHTVSKYGLFVEIVCNNISWGTAGEIEKHLIKTYGRKNNGTGILVNLTDGGEGAHGVVVSDEVRLKLSKMRKGVKKTKEWAEKVNAKNRGQKRTEASRLKMSMAQRKKPPVTEATKEKLRNRPKVSILTENQVREIRVKYIPYKYSTYKLGKEYGVDGSTIQRIISGKNWKKIA